MLMAIMLVLPGCDPSASIIGVDPDDYPKHLKGHPLAKCRVRWQQNVRMTVEIETPEDVRIASSVLELHAKRLAPWDTNNGQCAFRSDGEGEAIPVDLGKRGILFVAAAEYANIFVDAAAEAEGISPDATIPEEVLDIARRSGRRYPVAGRTRSRFDPEHGKSKHDLRPYFVRFTDISDWRTVQRVNPDAMDKSFGPGVRLRSLTMHLTDEPMTKGRIDKVLPWLTNTGEISTNPVCIKQDCRWGQAKYELLPYEQNMPGYSGLSLKSYGWQ